MSIDSKVLQRSTALLRSYVRFFYPAVKAAHFVDSKTKDKDSSGDIGDRAGVQDAVKPHERRQDQNQRDQQDQLTQHRQRGRLERLTGRLKIAGRNNLETGAENAEHKDTHTFDREISKELSARAKQAQQKLRREDTDKPSRC